MTVKKVEKTEKVEQLESQSIISILLSPDKMSAKMVLKGNADRESKITLSLNDVSRELKRQEIIYGVTQGVMEGAVEFYNEYGEDDEVIIAQGTPPQHGTKGKIEVLVKKAERKIEINDDGSINYHNVNTITTIKKGQPVCQRIPSEPGKEGKDVLGNIIKPREYPPISFPVITNTEVDKGNNDLLLSAIDGSVIFIKDGFKISNCHIVNGDVDFSVGNINYNGPVKIAGDVKSGFAIKAQGNIEIEGTVEDAAIESTGDVTVKCGFVGTGKGRIISGGDVKIGFVRNQTVKAEGIIYVDKEAIDSTLYSKKKIYTAGRGIGIAGGYAFAIEGMELSALGSESEVKTIIQVGSNPANKKQIDDISANLDLLKKKSIVLDKQLQEIEQAKRKSKNLFDNLIEKMEKIMEVRMNIEVKRRELIEKKKTLESQEHICQNPYIKTYGMIYPGIILAFHGFKRIIREKRQNKMFLLEHGTVVESPISSS